MRLPDLDLAAKAAAWGIPYRRLLSLSDPLLLTVEREIIARAINFRIEVEETLAENIGINAGNAVAKALGGR